jgi:N utilization substance protein B
MSSSTRSRSRSAARLAAVQALYQQEMEGTPLAGLSSTTTASAR